MPAAGALLAAAAARGDPIARLVADLDRLLDQYGAAEMQIAATEALERETPHANAVRLVLERRCDRAGQPPPVADLLPGHVRERDVAVRKPRLDLYDQLSEQTDGTV